MSELTEAKREITTLNESKYDLDTKIKDLFTKIGIYFHHHQ